MFLCVVEKNKNVRGPFASVTGRSPALPPWLGAALASLARVLEHPADHCTPRLTAPSGTAHPAGYLHPADHLHPVAMTQRVQVILSHCHTLPAGVQGEGV